MSLSYPLLLVLGLLVAAALGVGVVLLGRRRSAALAAAGISLAGRRNRLFGPWFFIGGVVVLAVAVAGPAASLPVGRSAGTVILAMDVSNSMSADDVTPSRLAAAQQTALSFIDAQPDSVDIGVVGFDQGALTTSQPTADRAAAKAAVQRLRTAGGTSLASAILGSLSAITGTPVRIGEDGDLPDIGNWGSATIVLISDGEDQGGSGGSDAVTAAATIAQNAGIHIEAVGVGTAEGATVEIDGYQLHTALDTEQLTAIAQATGGHYRSASDAEQLDDVASTIDLRLTVAKQDVPLAGGFIAVALVLLAVGAVVAADHPDRGGSRLVAAATPTARGGAGDLDRPGTGRAATPYEVDPAHPDPVAPPRLRHARCWGGAAAGDRAGAVQLHDDHAGDGRFWIDVLHRRRTQPAHRCPGGGRLLHRVPG